MPPISSIMRQIPRIYINWKTRFRDSGELRAGGRVGGGAQKIYAKIKHNKVVVLPDWILPPLLENSIEDCAQEGLNPESG